MPTRVKICGVTRLEDAQRAVELGAAALGFNFYPHSPRYIEPGAAHAIVRQLPLFVTAVGVFANESDAGHVISLAHQAGVTAVQMHGPGFPALHELLSAFTLVVAVAVREGFKPEELGRFKPSAYLLDAFGADRLGGTGKTFDWNAARAASKYGPIILAGGLTPENVARAVREVRPFAVDVASGVESAPGIKDPAKLRAFFAAVAEADRECSS
ncbi:MAG TPA: phosphoribosylanthranilate isomerase [Terriglobia bacterium]|nr:phosphoribosylanthranilate isomerase [Terriglobia bacterium]